MTIKKYQSEGETKFEVYINLRSKSDPSIRAQKRIKGLDSLAQAKKEEKKYTRLLLEQIHEKEGIGLSWEKVLHRWESFHLDRTNPDRHAPGVLNNYKALVNIWTRPLFKIPVSQISRADIRDIFKNMDQKGRALSYQKQLKRVANQIFDWAIEERIINENLQSPFKFIKLGSAGEKLPEILSEDEVKRLLREARDINHEWYPIWAMAVMTGMRSGELCALTWDCVDLDKEIIFVHKNYVSKSKSIGPTKGRYWRTIPISSDLKRLLIELKRNSEGGYECQVYPSEGVFVLPRFKDWYTGHQVDPLKTFCKAIGLKQIKFHTLRACFGTHLLNLGVSQALVMKMAGWKELKTMERYIRLSGIETQGSTEKLNFLPEDKSDQSNVVSLF